MKNLNLACGAVYVIDDNWINLDYVSSDVHVRQANLLETLPFDSNSISLVYSSHFLEHIPLHQVPSFLKECHRVLKPGGVIRLVLPDFEEMCREYLTQLDGGDYTKAKLCVIEIVDQCVRLESGGELAKAYKQYSKDLEGNDRIRAYIYSRNGQNLPLQSVSTQTAKLTKLIKLLGKPKLLIRKVIYQLDMARINILVSLLPKAFKEQNVSFTGVGERHHWLWDFYQLKHVLEAAGFDNIQRCHFNTSQISNFPFQPLDVNSDNQPRKGQQSMYLEAIKLVDCSVQGQKL
jgi:SAM-dependent methyltransferase